MVGRRSDGETFPLELVISQAEIPDGRLFVAIGQDVTERKRVEAALRESERRFRTIFDRAGIGIALVELGGRVLEANAALAEMLGVTRRSCAGPTATCSPTPRTPTATSPCCARCARGGPTATAARSATAAATATTSGPSSP
jgi:hypothetical protein